MKQKHSIMLAVAVLGVLSVLLLANTGMAAEAFGPGDPTGDGRVNSADARIALRMAARVYTGSDVEIKACDVNGDGKVTSVDARLILCVAAHIYDRSIFDAATSNSGVLVYPVAETLPDRSDYVPWNDILPQTEPRTYSPAETTKRVHPNNYNYGRPSSVAEESLTATSAPAVETATHALPTAVSEPVTAERDETTAAYPSAVVSTSAPPAETSSAAAPTEPAPAPAQPKLSIAAAESGDGTVKLTISVSHAASLTGGMLLIDYNPAVLSYIAAEAAETDGASVNIQPMPESGVLGCEFSFASPLSTGDYTFGSLVFAVKSETAHDTAVGVAVKEPARYNWRTGAQGDSAAVPAECRYYILLNKT